MQVDLQEIKKRSDQGLINTQAHPSLPLLIHNYTHQCQIDRAWDEYTLMCRGLITDTSGNIIARPFAKFFNVGELEIGFNDLPNEPFEATRKEDGSLGILFRPTVDDGWIQVATRGSFLSEQSINARKILFDQLDNPLEIEKMIDQWNHTEEYFGTNVTPLVEIIYPENRIVINYGEMNKLILLDLINNKTGKSLPWEWVEEFAKEGNFELVPKVNVARDELGTFGDRNIPNEEGIVIFFRESGKRFKIKYTEYCRIHRIVSGLTEKRVWELLRHDTDFDQFFSGVPEEHEEWIREIAGKFCFQFLQIEARARKIFKSAKDAGDEAIAETNMSKDERRAAWRKAFALYVTTNNPKIASVIFALLDNNDHRDIIWKKLRPKTDNPSRWAQNEEETGM